MSAQFSRSGKMPQNKDDRMISGLDENGNPEYTDKETWRTTVLPELKANAWDDPNMIYGVITLAADNGMAADIFDLAERAVEIDQVKERSHSMYAIVLMRAGELERSEKVVDDYAEKFGASSTMLSLKARHYMAKGENEKMADTLLAALKIDPNNEMALQWYSDAMGSKDDQSGKDQVLIRVAGFEGSWRAQTWLAHQAIEKKDKSTAVKMYMEAIEKSEAAVEPVTLAAVDLFHAGHVIEMIKLIEDVWDPQKHGPDAGISLVHGYIQTGEKEKAVVALNKVEGLRPDLGEQLQKIRQEIGKMK